MEKNSGGSGKGRGEKVKLFQTYGLFFAWLVALGSTISSIFLGEVLFWKICNLCWYQRICMFPLAILLGISAYRLDRNVAVAVIPQAALGGLIALYQSAAEIVPSLQKFPLCGASFDCFSQANGRFLDLPLSIFSLAAFSLIILFIALFLKAGGKEV
jgi:disulfide bond formation protein DsbB